MEPVFSCGARRSGSRRSGWSWRRWQRAEQSTRVATRVLRAATPYVYPLNAKARAVAPSRTLLAPWRSR